MKKSSRTKIKTLETRPIDRQVVSPSEFVRLVEDSGSNIKETRIIAPILGSNEFGSIEVTYHAPVYSFR